MRNYSGLQKPSDMDIQDIICFRTFLFVMHRFHGTIFRDLPEWVQRRAAEAKTINYAAINEIWTGKN